MSAPTLEDLELFYWMDFEQYYTYANGEATFVSETPRRVIDSYHLWERQFQSA